MFSFMKKGSTSGAVPVDKEEKEKRKREKKERKEKEKRERGSMTAEELLRLDEVRRSLKIRGRRKEKEKLPSGITADYSANFFAELDRNLEAGRGGAPAGGGPTPAGPGPGAGAASDPGCDTGSSDASLNSLSNYANLPRSGSNSKILPPLPPRPPKRGILKGPRLSITSITSSDENLLLRNTLQNEVIAYQNIPVLPESDSTDFISVASNSYSLPAGMAGVGAGAEARSKASASCSIDSLTDSSFMTPQFSLSPVGEGQGLYSKFSSAYSSSDNFENYFLPLPDVAGITLPEPRVVSIKRQTGARTDFGFSLRRAMVIQRNVVAGTIAQQAVVLAEPGDIVQHRNDSGLLPGDRLLEVDGVAVGEKSREQIIDLIKSAGASVTLKVQPISELSELSRRSTAAGVEMALDYTNIMSGTLRRSKLNKAKAKSEEQLANDRAWLEQERYWLVHRRGFTAVTKLPGKSGSMDDLATGVGTGKIRVSVLATNEEFSVDEDDLEKANPPQYDRSEDLAQLRFLNESSVLHTLRQRYAANLIHTYAGLTMLIMNPAVPLAIYSEKVAHLFRRCKSADMPAHIYSVAQSAYHSMLSLRRDHSIVFLGRAGSGKTINYKYVIKYLTIVAGANNKVLTLEKLNSIWTVLEAFGNAKTVLNNSATCFAHLFSLDFDQSGQIASASIQTMLFDRWRVARRPEGEGTFHILSRLVLGAEGNLRRDLMLGDLNPTDSNPYVHFNVSNEDKVQQAGLFKMVYGSLMQLGVSELENKIIFSVLAAILHLGAAGAAKGSTSSRWQFNSPIAAHRAAKCLGTTVEELSRIIFAPTVSTPTSNRSSYHSSSPGSDYGNRSPAVEDWTGQDALDGFVIGLYSEVFNIVAALINRHLSVGTHTVNTILVFDCPGFQNPASCGQQNGATFQDFCFNYLQERLQLLFHNTALVATRDRYTQEQIEVICDDTDEVSPEGIVNILDNIPSNNSSLSLAMRSSQLDLRQSDSTPGLLWLLDEHRSLPSQQSFVDSVFNVYREREHQTLINKAAGNHHLLIQHCQGTNPVLYNTENWTKLAREHPSTKAAVALLLESTHNDMATVFTMSRSANISSTLGGSLAGIDGTQSLRRASSIRRTFTSSSAAAIKRKSVALQVKFAVDGLIETLRRSKVKFVHCLLAQHNVAAVDGTKEYFDSTINVPLLRSQIRGAEVLPAVRLYKQGFPECMQLTEFIRRFGLLASSSNSTEASTPTPTDTKTSIEEILFGIDLDASSYRVGLSQIFFRSGVLAQLELQRDAKLTDRIIKLQSHCRGYLARKKLAKLKVEDLAVRCIQRNVRKFMSVRDWAWWRLLVRVTPLLNVHRTEEELKSKTEELESLRAKLDKLEQERNLLKHETDKLETKLSEMTVDLAEEHSTATVASERLEIETSERLRLEKELQEIQIKNKRLQENGERLELEVLHLHSADVNGSALHSEDDDDESGDRTGVYKRRYERVARELEFAKRRLDQQHQDDLEQLIGLRKQLEKKLADAYEEVEEQRQVVAQWKRKVQKLNSELNDVRLLLEEQNSRNILLEKKQRKFDAELQMLQDELRQERQQKERSSREREIAVSEKYSMEQTLSAVKLELELKEQKLVNLNRELEELMFNGSTEEEVANLKKSKHQLDNKIKDQEEELDDLAGQVQMLEQAKLKLEMSLEQMRKEHRRELMQKDDEIEDARCSAVKKVKALECQLESEHEERTLLLRERHELERRLNDLEDRERVNRTSDQEQLNRLRRDLKRTKALLQDAQIMLQQAKADTPNKTILRQLRNQLEDAECARNLAIKARQTAEADLLEVQLALEEATRAKNEAEEKSAVISRERSQLQTQLDENEEELAEVLKKYRATVQQLSSEQSQLREQVGKIVELETERQSLKEQLNEMTSRLENVGSMNDPVSSLTVKRLELKCKELESKLELEQTTRSRMEVQISRLKETVERLQSDTDIAKGREAAAQDLVRKLQRNIRDLKEQLSQHESRENSETVKRKELEKRLEESEAETSAAKTDLRLALQRIEDLQLAIQGELDQDDEDDDSATDSDNSASSDESFESFLTNHNSGSADRSSVIRSNFSRSEEVSPLKITNSSASAKESSSPPSSFA